MLNEIVDSVTSAVCFWEFYVIHCINISDSLEFEHRFVA